MNSLMGESTAAAPVESTPVEEATPIEPIAEALASTDDLTKIEGIGPEDRRTPDSQRNRHVCTACGFDA